MNEVNYETNTSNQKSSKGVEQLAPALQVQSGTTVLFVLVYCSKQISTFVQASTRYLYS